MRDSLTDTPEFCLVRMHEQTFLHSLVLNFAAPKEEQKKTRRRAEEDQKIQRNTAMWLILKEFCRVKK
jgi:hypothetical protein